MEVRVVGVRRQCHDPANDRQFNDLAIEVGEKSGQVFIQSHIQWVGELAFQPISLRGPTFITPAEFQLGNPAADMEQMPLLDEGVDRSSLGLTLITDSHSAEYDFPDRKCRLAQKEATGPLECGV